MDGALSNARIAADNAIAAARVTSDGLNASARIAGQIAASAISVQNISHSTALSESESDSTSFSEVHYYDETKD